MALPPGAVEDTVSKGGLPANLGPLYPFIGLFLGYVGTGYAVGVLADVPSLRPWLVALAFQRGMVQMSNAASLVLFGIGSGLTWGMAWWFIKDRRDALAASATSRRG